MTPIRVLRVITRMNVGGPALQVVGLSEGLPSDRFEQRLLTGSVGTGEADYLDLVAPAIDAVRIRGLGRDPSPIGDLHAFRGVVREIRRFRPHIIHTHTAKAGVVGRVAAVPGRVPARVHTFHGHLLHGYFSPRLTRVVVGVERTLARATTRLVAVGERVRDELLAAGIGKPEQFVVVPPGVDPAPTPERAAARHSLDLDPEVPVVAFVGRLTRVKRPDRFIAAARAIGVRRPDTVFLIAGEGDLLDDVRHQADRDHVQTRFLGWRPDVETVFAAADVMLLTSDNEGMPVSLIESAWAGCPAVTTDVGSASEVVADGTTGFVVDSTADALADAVLRLVEAPELRRAMSDASKARAVAQFSRQRLVDDTARLYEELAEKEAACRRS